MMLASIKALLRFIYLLLALVVALMVTVTYELGCYGLWTSQLSIRLRLSQWIMQLMTRALPMSVRYHGHLSRPCAMFVSNHVSWTDIPILATLAPLAFLSKAELRQWPVIGWMAEKAGTLFIKRGQGESASINQLIAERIQHKDNILIFPEGTTTDGSYVRPFFPRLFASVIDKDLFVQPIAICYQSDGQRSDIAPFVGEQTLMSHLIKLLFNPKPIVVDVFILEPIPSQNDRNTMAKMAHQNIMNVLETHLKSNEF